MCLCCLLGALVFFFFFFNDTATTEISPLPLHAAFPISPTTAGPVRRSKSLPSRGPIPGRTVGAAKDRKSTRLNSSHTVISYAVFCLKKKKKQEALPACAKPQGPHVLVHRPAEQPMRT